MVLDERDTLLNICEESHNQRNTQRKICMGEMSWERHFLACKVGKSLGEDSHTFQRGRERTYNYKFSKINALRKWRLGAYSQKEICLKFIQAERNSKAILITIILMLLDTSTAFLRVLFAVSMTTNNVSATVVMRSS